MEAIDSTDREVRSDTSSQDSLMDVDALLGNRAYAEEMASRSPMEAIATSAERAPSGPGTFVVAALVVIGVAGAVAVVYLLRRRRRQAERADDPVPPRRSVPPSEPGPDPEAGPRPRHAAPTFVVDDDTGDFPSIR